MTGVLVVWDFDWSLVNENSDTYVVQQLRPAVWASVAALRTSRPEAFGDGKWTALMAEALRRLHAADVRGVDIRGVLGTIPCFPETVATVQAIAARGWTQAILSDANTEYVAAVLDARGIGHHFARIVTNPAAYDAEGCLCVRPRQSPDAPHACGRCPENLCKG